MRILNLRDAKVKQAARHPALAGLPRLARGCFCAVYDKGDTVLKLTCDEKQFQYYADPFRPKGEFFPKLAKSYGDVGETSNGLPLYLVEMEKLQTIASGPIVTKRLARSMLQNIEAQPFCGRVALSGAIGDADLPQELLKPLEMLETFVANFECDTDFHMQNLMRRGEQLVLNDVVMDRSAFDSHRRARFGWAI